MLAAEQTRTLPMMLTVELNLDIARIEKDDPKLPKFKADRV
jgi:hypothetical protein